MARPCLWCSDLKLGQRRALRRGEPGLVSPAGVRAGAAARWARAAPLGAPVAGARGCRSRGLGSSGSGRDELRAAAAAVCVGETPGSPVPPRRALRAAPVPQCHCVSPTRGWGPRGKHSQSSQVFQNLVQQGRAPRGPRPRELGFSLLCASCLLAGSASPRPKGVTCQLAGWRQRRGRRLPLRCGPCAPPAKLDLLIGIVHLFSV